MDRNAIERHDFPVGRRGYDQAAVDAHLRAVADEIESLRANVGHAEPRALSAGTSEQVRVILEAAERSAADLKDQAGREAGEHVSKVEQATGEMLSRLDALGSELDGLLQALKRSGQALEAGLAQLREDVSGATPAPPPAPPEPEPIPEPPIAEALDEPADPGAIAEAAGAPANGTPDEAGARLIALNMALGGTPREETAAYLAEHYELADPEALLEDVYKRAGA